MELFTNLIRRKRAGNKQSNAALEEDLHKLYRPQMEGWKTADTAAGRLTGPAAPHHQTTPHAAQGSAFMFQRRRVPINWRHLAGLDVDRVSREMDFQALQQNIANVTYCNIEAEEFHGVDGNFIKLFRLAQLIIEYLLHSQQYLTEQRNQCQQQVQELQKELEVCHSEASARVEEVKTMKRENRKRRKIIEAYQDMLNHGATGLHPCPVCSKEFVSQQYLDSHTQRRHPDLSAHSTPAPSQEDIERRLMEQMNEKFQITEQQLKQELARKEEESLQNQAREFEQWKHTEQERRMFEFQEVEKEKEHLQRVLQEKQAEIEALKRQTHVAAEESVDFGGGVKGQDRSRATSKDIRQLENKVVTKWKKHKKNVHKQMQQMSKSYQDQLVEISEKLASMEQSSHPAQQTSSPDRKQKQEKQEKREEAMKRELKALQQKVMEQEQALTSQQLTLQDREPSPAPSASSGQNAEKALPVDSQSELSESYEEEEEEEEEGEGEGERTDSPRFTPFPNRNTVTTLFNHEQEAMEKIRRETASILDNALKQRGVTKGMAGMTDTQFDGKIKQLETERQQRIQMHYQFMEQRQRLAEEVEAVAAANCQFHPPPQESPLSSPLRTPPRATSPRHSSPRHTSPRHTSPPHSSPHHSSPHHSSSSHSSPHHTSPLRTSALTTSPPRSSPQRQQSTSPSRSQHITSASGRVSSKPPKPTGHGLHVPPTPQRAVVQPQSVRLASSVSGGAHTHTARQLQIELHVGDSETETESESESGSYEEEDDIDEPYTTASQGAHNRGATSRVIPRDGGVNVGPKLPPGAVRVLPAGAGDSGTGRGGQSGARGGGGGRGRGRGRGGGGGGGGGRGGGGRGGGGRGGGGKGRGQGYEGGGEKEEADDSSSWDSSEDSDHLSTQDLMSVPSSTPIHVLPVKTTKVSTVPPKPEPLSDNSWDVTESTESPPTSKRPVASSGERIQKLTATHSAGNSESALTTVSHGDFDDSDPSDLSTTQLT